MLMVTLRWGLQKSSTCNQRLRAKEMDDFVGAKSYAGIVVLLMAVHMRNGGIQIHTIAVLCSVWWYLHGAVSGKEIDDCSSEKWGQNEIFKESAGG